MSVNDTIIAIATPPGEGAIGVIRLSGNNAIPIVAAIFTGKDITAQASHTLHFGRIMDAAATVDEVVVSLFRSPKSYTGEDVVEVSCHGSQYVLQQVLQLCISQGARMAKPGEFTLRAFLNGKMDLTQAEAVADLIASDSGAAHKAAIHNLRGGFSNDLKQMREELIKFSALIELELDFSQEDVEFADRTQFHQLINNIGTATDRLLHSFRLGNVIKNGVKVAIVGKPNAGKSTLLNTLLNDARAIVSDMPGTTRDTIEETLNINGVLFRLVDTAGIREHAGDMIEEEGIARSLDTIKKADIVIYLFDASDPLYSAEIKSVMEQGLLDHVRHLFVGNKSDQPTATIVPAINPGIEADVIYISAKTGEGITPLKDALFYHATFGDLQTENTVITNARHYHALSEVLRAINAIKQGLDDQLPGDLLSSDIRSCLYYMGEITGEITTEDILDYIFSKFCIGK